MIFPFERAVRNGIIAINYRLEVVVGSRYEQAVRNASHPTARTSSDGSNGFPIARAVNHAAVLAVLEY